MIKFVNYQSTLVYYDGPELIHATDHIGGNYIGMAVDTNEAIFKFLVVGVAPTTLRQLRRGAIDLRSLILEAASDGWYTSETVNINDPLEIQHMGESSIPDSLLPDDDYFVSDPINDENQAMLEATDRENFVVHVQFEPRNPDREHRLNCKDYGDFILCLNSLIVSTLHSIEFAEDSVSDKSDIGLDIVTPAAEGSLRVLFEASNSESDIFNPHHLLVRALQQIDLAIGNANDANGLKSLSEEHGEEFAKKFISFMQVLERSNVDLQYAWAEPRFQTGNLKSVSLSHVQHLVASIKQNSNTVLSTSKRSIEGQFERFQRSTGKWGLRTEDGLVEGIIEKEERPTKLDGLEVGAQYIFHCEARLTFSQAWKNASPTLTLRKFDTIKTSDVS